jgi:hypothetical protein
MTLREMKDRVLSLIEEINPESEYLTDDPDIKEKINYVIDMKQHELARIKKLAASEKVKVKADEQLDLYDEFNDFYKLKNITGVSYTLFENLITFNEDGEATINYYRYPKLITKDTDMDKYKMELSMDVLEIMPYGVAADILKSDVSAQYGRVYEQAYQQALQMLDINTTDGIYEIKGGIYV